MNSWGEIDTARFWMNEPNNASKRIREIVRNLGDGFCWSFFFWVNAWYLWTGAKWILAPRKQRIQLNTGIKSRSYCDVARQHTSRTKNHIKRALGKYKLFGSLDFGNTRSCVQEVEDAKLKETKRVELRTKDCEIDSGSFVWLTKSIVRYLRDGRCKSDIQ